MALVIPLGLYLQKEFRNFLFCKCYENTGSLGGIAKALGYLGRVGINGPIRRMWLGQIPIPEHQLARLLKLAKVTTAKALEYYVPKTSNQCFNDWNVAFSEYRLKKKELEMTYCPTN